MKAPRVDNTLSLIALFCFAAEGLAVAIFPLIGGLEPETQRLVVNRLSMFVVTFPVFVALAFFVVLWNKHWVFYGPSDYADGSNFLEVTGTFSTVPSDQNLTGETIRNYWMPDGKVNPEHFAKLTAWMEERGIDDSIAAFIVSNEYGEQRSQAVADLEIG